MQPAVGMPSLASSNPTSPSHQPTIDFFHSLTVYLESCLAEGVFTFANSSAEVLSDQVSSNVFPFPMLFIVLPFTFNAQKHTRMTILQQITAHYWAQSQSTLQLSLPTPQFSTLFPEFGYQMSPHFVPDISSQMMATSSEPDDLSCIPSSLIYQPSILPNAPITEDYPTLNTMVPYVLPINHNPILQVPNTPTTGDHTTLNTMVPYLLPINQNFNNLQQQVYNTSGSLADQGPPTLR